MSPSDQGHGERPRNRQGRYVMRAETADRDAKACRLRTQGLSYDQIATALGFRDRSGARRAVQRALAAVVREDAKELILLEEARLDDLTRTLQRVMTTRHYLATASGKLATHPETGELIPDDAPVIAAARELRQVSESRRRLLGLDAPARHRVDVVDNEAVNAELLRMAEEFERIGDAAGASLARKAIEM